MSGDMVVYRALAIPRLCDGAEKYVEEYPVEEFREHWIRFLKLLAEGIEATAAMLRDIEREIERRGGRKPGGNIEIKIAVDVLTWLIKAPAFLDIIPGAVASPYKLYAYYLYHHVIDKYTGGENLDHLEEIWVSLKQEQTGMETSMRLAKLADRMQQVFSGEGPGGKPLWLYILEYPADTRPGYNSVSLLVHSLLVSGIAWALAEARGTVEPPELYALAGLLHDIGKPVDPKRNVLDNEEIGLGRALRELIGTENYERLRELIRTRHEEGNPITDAERHAAGERNTELVRKILGEKLHEVIHERGIEITGDPVKELYENDSDKVWGKWDKIGGEKIRDLSKEYAKKLWGKILHTEKQAGQKKKDGDTEKNDKTHSQVGLVLVDISGVQDMIRAAQDLSIMAVTSYLIDTWLIAELPARLGWDAKKGYEALENKWVPLSAFIYASGGKALMVLPKKMIGDAKRFIRDTARLPYVGERFGVAVADTDFTPVYPIAKDELDSKVEAEKLLMKRHGEHAPGLHMLCSLCGTSPAQTVINIGGEERPVCFSCLLKRRVARMLVYGKPRRMARIDGIVIDRVANWNDVEDWIEVIAGMHIKRDMNGRILNYAVVTMDGNIAGRYMAASPSYTSLVEKSLAVDYALKYAVKSFAGIVYRAVKRITEEYGGDKEKAVIEAARLYLGTLYLGGDDGKIVAPAHLVPAMLIYIPYVFAKTLGCTLTLSIGAASAPPKHNIWGLNDASIGLEERAKVRGRMHGLRAMQGSPDAYGAVDIYYTDTTSLLTRSRISAYYGEHEKAYGDEDNKDKDEGEGIAAHGLSVKKPNEEEAGNITWILDGILRLMGEKPSSIEKLVEKLVEKAYLATTLQCRETPRRTECLHEYGIGGNAVDKWRESAGRVEEVLKHIDRAYREILEVAERFRDTASPLRAAAIYAMRQHARGSGSGEWGLIARLLALHALSDKKPPLDQLRFIADLLGGGAV